MTPLRFACPNCGAVLTARPDMAGRTAKCKTCGRPFVVPAVGDPALAAPAAATPAAARGPIPDFSHLRPTGTDRDDSILGDPEDGDDDCVLSAAGTIPAPQVTPPVRPTARPTVPVEPPPTLRTPADTPVYKPPVVPPPPAAAAAETVNPFADLGPSGDEVIGEGQPTTRLLAGGSKVRKREPAGPGALSVWLKAGGWKGPAVVALAVYAAAATALAVWGWARH